MRVLPAKSTKDFRDPYPGARNKTPLGKVKTVEETVDEKDRYGPAVIVDLSAEAKALIS